MHNFREDSTKQSYKEKKHLSMQNESRGTTKFLLCWNVLNKGSYEV